MNLWIKWIILHNLSDKEKLNPFSCSVRCLAKSFFTVLSELCFTDQNMIWSSPITSNIKNSQFWQSLSSHYSVQELNNLIIKSLMLRDRILEAAACGIQSENFLVLSGLARMVMNLSSSSYQSSVVCPVMVCTRSAPALLNLSRDNLLSHKISLI